MGRNSFSVFVLNDRNKIYWRVNFGYICCRGSQEPRGSKSFDCKEALIVYGRGSQEPRGSKSSSRLQSPGKTLSRLARASWIEIPLPLHSFLHSIVEARKSLVDRNYNRTGLQQGVPVEARKSLVDRNCCLCGAIPLAPPSRLARASWIEITASAGMLSSIRVEARKSLVDRNRFSMCPFAVSLKSRLARASWIEI